MKVQLDIWEREQEELFSLLEVLQEICARQEEDLEITIGNDYYRIKSDDDLLPFIIHIMRKA